MSASAVDNEGESEPIELAIVPVGEEEIVALEVIGGSVDTGRIYLNLFGQIAGNVCVKFMPSPPFSLCITLPELCLKSTIDVSKRFDDLTNLQIRLRSCSTSIRSTASLASSGRFCFSQRCHQESVHR